MRSRRPGDVRTRSPPTKMRDHRSQMGPPDPYLPPRNDTRKELRSSHHSLSPSRRVSGGDYRNIAIARRDYAAGHLNGGGDDSLSPSRRISGGDRRNIAVERRDYAAGHLNGGRDDSLSPSRRISGGDHRNIVVERRDYAVGHLNAGTDDSLPSKSPPFRQSRKQSQFEEGFPHTTEFRRKYLLSEPTDLNGDASLGLKSVGDHGPGTSRISNEKELHGSGLSAFDGNGLLVRKSMYLEDGTVRPFFTLPPDVGPSINAGQICRKYSFSVGNADLHKGEGLRYPDNLHPDKISVRESYIEEEKSMFCSRDGPYSMTQLAQIKSFGNTSSGLPKDKFLGSYKEGPILPSDGFGRIRGKSTDPFAHDGYIQEPLFDSGKDSELRPKVINSYPQVQRSPTKEQPGGYTYPELKRKEEAGSRYFSDERYRKIQPSVGVDYSHRDLLRPSFLEDNIEGTESSRRNFRESDSWDHPSLQGKPLLNHLDMDRRLLATRQDEEFLGSKSNRLELVKKGSQDRDISYPGVDYGFGRDVGSGSYKESVKSPPMSDCDLEIYRYAANPQRGLQAEDLDIYDSFERAHKRKYRVDEEMSRLDRRSLLPSNSNSYKRTLELSNSGEQWTDEDLGGVLLSKRLSASRSQIRKAGRSDGMTCCRVSASDNWMSSQDLSVNAKERQIQPHIPAGRNVNIKKRLRFGPLNFHNSYPLGRRRDFHKPFKLRKRSLDDHHGCVRVHDSDPSEDRVSLAKSEPPEDSEEFKQLVHKAFLQFSKQLNENTAQRRRYKEQGKAGTMLCNVCGSLSKEFLDARSLVTHAFMSLKVGLRAEHLGLHKALCVLLGWNSIVASGSLWVQQVLPDAEALALKEDLILWPPLVIIHNSSIGNKNPDEQKIVTVEGMEAILRDMGFRAGKTKVCRGKPANQSVIVVKFLGIFSGLEEAERLHKYYSENKRGRVELQRINSNSGCSSSGEARGTQAEKLEDVLYGYLGIAEDFGKLDFETKKRTFVKSKKDIKAIAHAPLRDE